ncbi:hypothetical protein ACU4GD_35295 [Cupriavidus basilensis]
MTGLSAAGADGGARGGHQLRGFRRLQVTAAATLDLHPSEGLETRLSTGQTLQPDRPEPEQR